MDFSLNDPASRRALAGWWKHAIQGQTLCAILYPETVLSQLVPFYEDALVFQTAELEIACMIDAAGARVRIGRPEIEAGTYHSIWSRPAALWRPWPHTDVLHRPIADLSLHVTSHGSLASCRQIAILIHNRWYTLRDRCDLMQVDILPNTMHRHARFSSYIRSL